MKTITFLTISLFFFTTSVHSQYTDKTTSSNKKNSASNIKKINNWEKEPDKFLGIKLGEKLTIAECPTKLIPNTSIATIDMQALENIKEACLDMLDDDSKYSPNRKKLYNLPALGVAYSGTVHLRNDIVSRVTLNFMHSNFDILLSAFKERYGQPTYTESNILKTNAGAEFDSKNLLWQGKNMTIAIYERFGRIDKSLIVISDNSIMDAEIKERGDKTSSEAKKF